MPEAFNLLANIHAFPKHIAYIVTHNCTVNMHGREGHGKPIDQMLLSITICKYNQVIRNRMNYLVN